MAFNNANLISLISNSGFNMWLYRTTDSRATVLVAGYFSAAAGRMAVGDIIILQASDSLAYLPVRSGAQVGAGLVLDSTAAPFAVTRTGAQRFSVRQAASAVAMTVLLAPLAAGILSNGVVQAQAAVAGPISEVAFSIRDASGATVRGPQTAPVAGGTASATLAAPVPGTGYRLRVEAPIDPDIADTSPAFSVTAPFALLLQSGGTILLEDGGRLIF